MSFSYELRLEGGNHAGMTLSLERPAPLGDVVEFRWPCCGQLYAGERRSSASTIVLSYVAPAVPDAFDAAWDDPPRLAPASVDRPRGGQR